MFQIGAMYLWSYVYHIVRVYSSSKDSDEPKLDELPEGAESAGETTENLPKCRTAPLLPLKEPSLEEGHMEHLELDCVVPQEKAKVIWNLNIYLHFFSAFLSISIYCFMFIMSTFSFWR